nr:MAG TPA: hypothetical protein [Caudoviricetes sp.]
MSLLPSYLPFSFSAVLSLFCNYNITILCICQH